MDSQTLWCELVAVTPKYIQSELESARSSVDFFVTLLYLSGIFAVTCLVIGVIEHFKIGILLLSIPALLLAVLSHWLAIRAIDAWSYPVHALVNLGRAKLADSLGLRLPETIVQEKAMWGLVVRYAYYADQKYGEKLDMYRKPTEPRSESVSREKAESEPDENGGDDAETKT
jgi:hypothetical protein